MENPATWGKAEIVVKDAIQQHNKNINEGIIGYSLVRVITNALRAEGLLIDGSDH